MDLGGIWAMLNFPSMITGFCGRVFAHAKDVEVGKAAVKAWNDWLWTEWFQSYPDRIIPCGIVYLSDPAGGSRRDPTQRGPRIHVRDAARATARRRIAEPVGSGLLGSHHRSLRGDRHRDLVARRQLRRLPVAAGFAHAPTRLDDVRAALVGRLRRMALVAAIRWTTRRSRSR